MERLLVSQAQQGYRTEVTVHKQKSPGRNGEDGPTLWEDKGEPTRDIRAVTMAGSVISRYLAYN